jgi:hypothetical protein
VKLAIQIKGLKARQVIARGEAPGNWPKDFQALKGRNQISSDEIGGGICVALSGLRVFAELIPGASPRAITLRPYRAGEGMVIA